MPILRPALLLMAIALGPTPAALADGLANRTVNTVPVDQAGNVLVPALLLEAAQDGSTAPATFSGSVQWTQDVDANGRPTLVGKASIPGRTLSLNLVIHPNTDRTLPASEIVEAKFDLPANFIGGAISGLPGIMMKNEKMVQGTPLQGAAARVVVNSFLFALPDDAASKAFNDSLLTNRKWMDLALTYATGQKAILTLGRNDADAALFAEVVAAWRNPGGTSPVAAPAITEAVLPNAQQTKTAEAATAAYQHADYAAALRLWRPLARLGIADAQQALGTLYALGKGVPRDYVTAYLWFALAANAGYDLAASDRDRTAALLTPAQLEKAKKQVRQWKPSAR